MRDENTVRVKDGARRERWRGLEEILEETEMRFFFPIVLSNLFSELAEVCDGLFSSLSFPSLCPFQPVALPAAGGGHGGTVRAEGSWHFTIHLFH